MFDGPEGDRNAPKGDIWSWNTYGEHGGPKYQLIGKIARAGTKNCRIDFEDGNNHAQVLTEFAHC